MSLVLPTDFVLLVSARKEKGFGLLVEIAERCPEIRFVVIANESPKYEAESAVREAAVNNITVLEKTGRMAELYRAARVVVVPSYQFVETFSRVCIEAQRYGKPVVGSNVGDVPNLLAESGVVLEEDVDAWVGELRRLFQLDNYYLERCTQALANSARYSQKKQRDALNRTINGVQASILVGLGSGIGNLLHVGPTIRNLALRSNAPVDLLVSQDHSDSLFLLQRSEFVSAVYSLGQVPLSRWYDTVFVTHSFGGTRIPLPGRRVLWSRDWKLFEPGVSEHETIFNLEALKALLGIPYVESDVLCHYIGELDYHWPGGKIVGFHGGSKEGHWVAKRWPGYQELASRLTEQGYEVRSYGTPDEFVPGTVDCTGGTIESMTRRIMECSYFVSNDSGLMNIANALGIPVLSIFGPTEARTRAPMGPLNAVVQLNKSCSPCEVLDRPKFRRGDCRCIGEITLDQVLEKFNRLTEHSTKSSGQHYVETSPC